MNFASMGNFYANTLIPKDAALLRGLFRINGEWSKETGWSKIHTSILLPRLILGPLTIPLALIDSASYAARGILRFGVEVVDGNPGKAITALAKDVLSALQCLVLTVANVAYAVLGLAFGSCIYSNFIPRPLEPTEIESLRASLLSTQSALAIVNQELRGLKAPGGQIENLKDAIETNKRELSVLRQVRDENQKELETRQNKITALTADLDKAKGFIEESKKSLTTAAQAQFRSMESQVALLQGEKGGLEEQNAAIRKEKAALETKLKDFESLKSQIKSFEDKILLLEAKLSAKENEAALKEKEIATLQIRAKAFEELDAQCAVFQARAFEAEEANRLLSKKFDEDKEELRRIFNSKIELNRSELESGANGIIGRLEIRNNEMREELRRTEAWFQQELKARERVGQALEAQIAELQYEKSKLLQTMTKAGREIDRLKSSQEIPKAALESGESSPVPVPDPSGSMTVSLKPEDVPFSEQQRRSPEPDGGPPALFLWNLVGMAADTAYDLTRRGATAANKLGIGLSNTFRKLFVDGKDPWKTHRYDIGLEQIIEVFDRDEVKSILELKNVVNGNDTAAQIYQHLQTALINLTTPELFEDPRKQKVNFQDSLRKALLLLQTERHHGITPDLEKRINALCARWMTSVQMLPYNYKMVLYVASKGNPELLKELELDGTPAQAPLSRKFRLLLEGIKKADDKYKAPKANLDAAKLKTVRNDFDPLRDTNMPSQWATTTYKKKDGTTLETVHFRTGVPVFKRAGKTEAGNKPWEIDGISLVPEYLALLNHLKANKEKLLVMLHLDPMLYNTTTGELKKPETWGEKAAELAHLQKQREALWIKLMVDLAKHPDFKDVLAVALFPMDGDWLKKGIQEAEKNRTLKEMTDYMVDVVTREDSPYILPGLTAAEKEPFVREVAKQMTDQYFIPLKDHTLHTLNKDQMLAFVGLFNSQAAEALQLKQQAKFVQRNCKDAVDRTMALVGCELSEKNLRLGRLHDPKVHEQILGTTLGPALGILKRQLLEERQPVLLATNDYLDWLVENKHPIGPAPAYAGYSLDDIKMGEDQTQCLYPSPSAAGNADEYTRLLRFEQEHPFALPNRVQLPTLFENAIRQGKLESEEALLKQVDRDLPTLKFFFGSEEVVFKGENARQQFIAKLKERKILEEGAPAYKLKNILTACQQNIFADPLIMLHKRYEKFAFNYHVVSSWKDDKVPTGFIYRFALGVKGHHTLSIERPFVIRHAGDGKSLAALHVNMTIDLDDAKKAPEFSYKVQTLV